MKLKQLQLFACCLIGVSPAFASASSALSQSAVDASLAAADSAEHLGLFAVARQHLGAAARLADAPLVAVINMRICAAWRLQGVMAAARECYTNLAGLVDSAGVAADARYQAAALLVDLGEAEAGRQELTRLVDELPYTQASRRAFTLARNLYRELGGPLEESNFLLAVASRLAWVAEPGAVHRDALESRALLAESLVEVGRIRLTHAQDPLGAQRMLQRALAVAQATAWEDDAMMWMARTCRALGERDQALLLYRQLIETQRAAAAHGTQFTCFFDDALFEVGQTLEEQRRFKDAEAAYAELVQVTPNSRLTEQAARRLALLEARQRSGGGIFEFVQRPPTHRVQTLHQANCP